MGRVKLPFGHIVIAFIQLSDSRAFVAVRRIADGAYSTHDVDAAGNCVTGHYDMTRAESLADLVARAQRAGALSD